MCINGRRIRERVGFLALLLLLLGSAATPLLDAWLHSRADTPATAEKTRHGCMVCRFDAAPLDAAPEATVLRVRIHLAAAPPVAAPRPLLRTAPPRLSPPSRAPPRA